MSPLINYAKRRDEGFTRRAAAILAGLHFAADKAVGAVMVITGLFLWLALPNMVDAGYADHKHRADHAEMLLIGCLNQGVIYIDGLAHECRPVSLGVKL